jgi:CheY-like chemotaxis protein
MMMLANPPRDAPRPPEARLAGTSVLVVDDDTDTLELLAFVLGWAGAAVRTARSAAEARLGSDRPPNLVITDLAMPSENGLCVLRDAMALRQTAGQPVRVILLTAHADPNTRQTAEGLGFDLVLVKPVDPLTVVDEIVAVLAR